MHHFFRSALLSTIALGTLGTALASSPPGWNFSGLGATHLVAGNPNGSGRGEVHVYHDSSSIPLFTLRSPRRRDLFGVTNAGVGDVDGDGFDDIVVGAPLAGEDLENHGAIHLYSSATGQELLRVSGFGTKSYFGRAVGGCGDIDGDGVPDLIVSGWIYSELDVAYGRVYLLSGIDGSVLRTVTSFEAGDGFGYTVVGLGDISGDGVPEVAISAPNAQTGALGEGAVYIFDLSSNPSSHITTSDTWSTIKNASLARDYFGSIIAYDDLASTSSYDSVLIGSVDPISYGSATAQFIFSKHKLGTTQTLGQFGVPALTSGDAIADGKVTGSDFGAVGNAISQGTGTTSTDLDGDGQVDSSDLSVVVANFGASSPIQNLISDPSSLVSRIADLTSGSGDLNVEPGEPGDWIEPIDCNDDNDDDDSDDNDDDDSDDNDDGGPTVQPGEPGVRPQPGGGGGGPKRSVSPPTYAASGDDGCDDDDDNDGGCGGCEVPDGEDEDCDAFANTDIPKFLGRATEGVAVRAWVTSDAWVVSLSPVNDGDAYGFVQQGAVSTNGIAYNAVIAVGDLAGDTKFKWTATNADTGTVVTQCFTVQVVNYEPVELTYKTFIPCEVVALSPLLRFSGDDRYICDSNISDFAPQGASRYRSAYTADIVCDYAILGSDPLGDALEPCNESLLYTAGWIPNKEATPYGNTLLYSHAAGVPTACTPTIGSPACDLDLAPGSMPIVSTIHPGAPAAWVEILPGGQVCKLEPSLADGYSSAFTVRLAPNAVRFRYWLQAGDPLLRIPWLGNVAPAINVSPLTVDAIWTVDQESGNQTVRCTLAGHYDPYPTHEVYVRFKKVSEPLFAFDPVPQLNGPFSLVTLPLIGPSQQFTGSEVFGE